MKFVCLFAALTTTVAATYPVHGQDASWGCQILLCAASSNPSWRGVPYCIAPMTRLLKAMKKPRFKWPICHEAKSGAPGRMLFEECPTGFVSADDDRIRLCSKVVNQCKNRSELLKLYGDRKANEVAGVMIQPIQTDSDNGPRNSCEVRILKPRPRRENPYYFDIPNSDGVTQRHWFKLER